MTGLRNTASFWNNRAPCVSLTGVFSQSLNQKKSAPKLKVLTAEAGRNRQPCSQRVNSHATTATAQKTAGARER